MRTSGILLHVSSLSSPYGIGTFGKEAFDLIDFLKLGGQTYWQILPIGPTSYGDSPYQSFSAYALNPYFIDLRLLTEAGLLKKEEYATLDFGKDETTVDYAAVYRNRFPVLRRAAARFFAAPPADYAVFCKAQADWLPDYALFMALKDAHDGAAFTTWEASLRRREPAALEAARAQYAADVDFYTMLQYLAYRQWERVKAYAGQNGVKIIGDMPIYVAADSADVWACPHLFRLDADGAPVEVAGCPPDAFSKDGQLWGNPLYDWKAMEKDGYDWWCRRIQAACTLFDVVRIDHFRGFEAYYAIPGGATTAQKGRWRKGPGMKLFRRVRERLGDLPIIAEDLGFLTPAVHKLLKATGFPGMKVLQFGFDPEEESAYLPHNYPPNCVVYTGTHDNDTINGWAESTEEDVVQYARDYLRLGTDESLNWCMMKAALASPADTAILTMQDLLGLGSEGRMNTPSTVGGNWQWRVTGDCLNSWLAGLLYENNRIYRRLPPGETAKKATEQ